ncbi:hypothetical protein EZV62_009533 [Acer yangbiense]|uniref:Uncharacterized protein n=1 Tax=Acer yangbiense TaxID=1000413 RepID=A0A5C7I0K1_9ROSI|nr:hypothetical protein EZV62_009533 [Acer yangbiense]
MATMASKVSLSLDSQPFHDNSSIPNFKKCSTTQKPIPSQEEDNQSTVPQNGIAEVESSEKKESSAASGHPKPKLKIKFRIKESKSDDQEHAVSNVDSTSQVQTQTLVASDCRDPSNQIKPWKLRSSRKDQDRASASTPVKAQLPSHEPAQLGSGLGFDTEMTMEKRKRSSFSIALTKEEIEADLLAITGSKPTARPKKRPKNVQRQLDNLFPGLCLKSITPNSYKVRDAV